MKKRRKVGVWLLIFMLVLTQISFPGARVQANGNEVSTVAVTESETDSQDKAEEGATAAKSKSTEHDSKKTTEDTEAAEAETSSAKEEKNTADEENTDKKESADEETQDKEDADEETKKKESSEKVGSPEDTSEEQKEDKNTDQSEKEKSENKSDENAATTEAIAETTTEAATETPPAAISESGTTTPAQSRVGLSAKVKEGEDPEAASYTVKIQPMDGDSPISDAEIRLETTTTPNIPSTWVEKSGNSGTYQLLVQENGEDCYYRFCITATDYYQFASDSFSFTKENSYIDINSLGEETIVISQTMEKKSDWYHVEIKAVDEVGTSVTDANIRVQRSTDQNTWDEVSPESSGQYKLAKKVNGEDCYYKYSIDADYYYAFNSSEFTDPSALTDAMVSLQVDEEGKIIIQTKMVKKYRVTIKAVDEKGQPISNARVKMEWRKDIYNWYDQTAVSPGVYDLNLRYQPEPHIFRFYRFTVTATDYTKVVSSNFCFSGSWTNPYFNAKTVESSFTITVQMELKTTTLANAKTKAIDELESYKNPADYRIAEKENLQELIQTWSGYINNASSIDLVEYFLKTAKEKIDLLKTNRQYEDEEYRSRIYFQTADGQKTYADEYGVVTITNIDSGNFYITRPDGSLYQNNEWDAKWRCVYEYSDQDHPGNIAFSVIVGTYGQYAGKFVGNYDATVELSNLGRKIPFTVKVIDGRVDQLRAYVDGKNVSGKTIQVMGSEKKYATIQGRLKGTNRWISIPAYALKYFPGGSTSMNNVTAEFRTWGTSGSITYTLDADRSVSTTINISATIVHPTGVTVVCPSKATVGDWNGAFNQYVGIMEGQGEGYYHVVVTPSNASNPGVVWEDLTPDVATFQSLHAAGIVPKKAGTAKFKVSCVDNPSIYTTVSILFQYEKPLKTAEAEKNIYYAKPGDKTINLNIITNGQKDSSKGASEQRFNWSYSTSGVAKVTDSVHYDKSSVTIPNWFSHTITILGEGTVTVTGIPWDSTENCKPVKFKVVVSSDIDKDKAAAERVEQLILGIGKVTLEKKNQIKYARAEFQALTSTQKGLVDDEIYAKLVAAELELRRLERGDTDEDEGSGGNGGHSSGGDGTGSDSGGTGITSAASQGTGGDGVNSSGGDGTGFGESGVGDDSSMAGTGDQSAADAAAHKNAVARRRTNSPAVVQAKTTNNTDTSAGKKSGAKGNGKKFYEIDIQDIPKEVIEIVDSISPETKIAVAACVLIAFIYGFMRRRRQHLSEETEQALYKD